MSSAGDQESEHSALLSDMAMAALALERQPFASEPDRKADGAFIDERRTERLAEIRQALLAGDDLLLVLGERGAGKSALLAQLAANSGLRIQCFSVRGGPRFSTLNLFVGMLEAFKVRPPEQLKETLDELIPCLQAMIGNDTLCVVVLDDADAVPADELTTLLSAMLYLNSGEEALLRIALAAPPAFEERIPDVLPRGADLPYASLVLEPYGLQRAGLYLAHRLERAGMRGEFPFDEAELTAINERAGGRPGALHAAAAAALELKWGAASAAGAAERAAGGVPAGENGSEAGLSTRGASAGGAASGRAVRLALGSLAALMIVGGLLLFGSGPDPQEEETRYRVVEERRLETERPQPETPGEIDDGALGDVEGAAGDPSGTPTALEPTPGTSGSPAPDATAAGEPAPTVDTATESARADESPLSAEPDSAPGDPDLQEPDPGSASSSAPSSSTSPSTASEPAEPATAESDASAPPAEPDPTAASGSAAAAEAGEAGSASPADDGGAADEGASASLPAADGEAGGTATDEAPTVIDTGPRSDAALLGTDDEPETPPAETAATSVLESPNWILVQDASLYTVQMIASTDRSAVEAFLSRAGLDPPNSIFSFDRRERTWYALVHGLFPSIEAARAEVERMPPVAITEQPWIRAVGRVQNSLREQD